MSLKRVVGRMNVAMSSTQKAERKQWRVEVNVLNGCMMIVGVFGRGVLGETVWALE